METQYLAILRRLLDLRRRYSDELNEQGFDLVDRAIAAAFRECVDAGVGKEARAIVSASK